jgi:oxepin-CoA hydrolase/3-oxo-5,6-dehydrosuberyl-CoA semialdehyde dehydrogenase
VLANYGLDNLRFFKPVVARRHDRSAPDGEAARRRANPSTAKCAGTSEITNQNGETVASYELLTMNATELGAAQASLAPA